MSIPTSLLDATASRFALTAPTPPVRLVRPATDDGLEEPTAPRASDSPPSLLEPPRAPPPLAPGDVLHAALLAVAGDDATCAMLLASATVQARGQLSARLGYVEMTTPSGRSPAFAALVESLNAAADDSARTATLSRAPPALLVELATHLRPTTCEEAAQRYMVMIRGF